MDRSTCILIYSEKSDACNQIFDRIKSLDFDLARITGLAFLCVDKSAIHDWYRKVMKLKYVPALYIRYFSDDDAKVLEGKRLVLQWIDAICDELGRLPPNDVTSPPPPPPQPQHRAIVDTKRRSAIDVAMEMQKEREKAVKV